MTMKKRLAVDTSTAMSVMALVSLLLLAAAYVLYRQKALSPGTVAFLGDAATAAGLLVVVIGIWLAAMALRQTERSSDIGVAAARQWLVDRRKLESQIDYLFFASPHIFAEILAVLRACMEKEWALLFPDGFPDNAAGEDAIRALLAEADNDRFAFATDPGSRDSFSGYRFGHALVQLSHLGVFDDGSGPHSRVRSLYGTPAPRAPAA